MGNNDKAASPKTTTTEPAKTTTDPVRAVTPVTMVDPAIAIEPTKLVIEAVRKEESGKANTGAIKTSSDAIESSSAAVKQGSKLSVETPSEDKKAESSEADARTKMDTATEIYKRMKKTKGVTRKEIIEQFVAEAKLSKAGASTYYQLIKAKIK